MFSYNLKNEIKKRMKPFSQLKEKHGIEAIYRTSEKKWYSSKNLFGFPSPRGEPDSSTIDISQPIWFATDREYSSEYCDRNSLPKHKQRTAMTHKKCATYKYIPRDVSLVKNKNLLFLDLNGSKNYLDNRFIRAIYDYILAQGHVTYTHPDDKQKYIHFKEFDDTILLQDFLGAYGYENNIRDSQMDADRYFTVLLFRIIKDLNICEEMDCIFMGYYHADVTSENSVLPSEFAIPYKSSINTKYMEYCGMVLDGVIETEIDYCVKKEVNKTSQSRKRKHTAGKLHLFSFKIPALRPVMSKEGVADCASSMRKSVKRRRVRKTVKK